MAGHSGETVAIVLAGGRGERARPITLAAADYLRSKALIPFLGRPLIEWLVEGCRDQGVTRFLIVVQGLENRTQIAQLLGHGERYGVQIRYSPARLDRYNAGSGSATLHNLEHWDVRGQALVLPVDSMFDFDLAALTATHREHGAEVTVAGVARPAEQVAGKYGVMRVGAAGRVEGFVEKPRLDDAVALAAGTADGQLPTNAGMYLVDCDLLRRSARDPELVRLSQRGLDWGGDLLPWLVATGRTVAAHSIADLGDLGSVRDYLDTVRQTLGGAYPWLTARLPRVRTATSDTWAPHVWIDPTSLHQADYATGQTLAEKLADGSVSIGPGVRIGRHVEIGPGVTLEHADIGDGAEIREGALVRDSAVGDGVLIGPYASITDSYLGPLARIDSTRAAPVRLEGCCAIGDGALVRAGAQLSGVSVYPRLKIPAAARLPAGVQLTSASDVLGWTE